MNIWKRNAIISVVVLFVCVAVYLNWSYNRVEPVSKDYEQFEDNETGKVLGEAAQVNAYGNASPSQSGDPQASGTADPSPSPSDGAAASGSYFSEARLSRQEARDSALSVLNQETVNEDATQESRDKVAEDVSTIANNALKEVRIENLVKAKGYSDCVAFISEDGISIVVAAPASGLNNADVAKIRDIAQGETEFSAEQIKIVEVK